MSSLPRLVISLPNSGSDWLMRGLVSCNKSFRYYDKEFFNPICNLPLCDRLLEAGFHSELISYKSQQGNYSEAEIIYDEFKGQYNLNKEVYAHTNLNWFKERFDCIILLRHPADLFPPSRLRVLQWYYSLSTLPPTYEFLKRVWQGFEWGYKLLQESGLPTIWYGPNLNTEVFVQQGWINGVQALELQEYLISTFRPKQELTYGNWVVFNPELNKLELKHV